MRLNDSTLRGKLKNYLQGDKFQKEYAEQVVLKKGFNYWTRESLNSEIKRLKRRLWETAVEIVRREESGSSRLSGSDPNYVLEHRITDVQLYPQNPNLITSCRVELYFNPDFVQSASLYPQGYPNGVDNIVRLLTNGWDFRSRQDRDPSDITSLYRGRMHGDWHLGSPKSRRVIHNVYAVTYRRGTPALFNTISQYNAEKADDAIFATLSSQYVGAYGIGGLRASYNKSGNSQIDSWNISGIGTIRFGTKH